MRPATRTSTMAEDPQTALVNFARKMGWAVMVGTPPKSMKEKKTQEKLNKLKGYK